MKCIGPDCEREPAPGEGGSKELCSGHYQQQRRGKPLTPIRKGPAMVQLQGLRMPADVKEAIEAEKKVRGEHVSESDIMREALEQWAERRRKRLAKGK